VYINADIEFKSGLRWNVLVCIRMHEQERKCMWSCCLFG